jgi:hypothetical protein
LSRIETPKISLYLKLTGNCKKIITQNIRFEKTGVNKNEHKVSKTHYGLRFELCAKRKLKSTLQIWFEPREERRTQLMKTQVRWKFELKNTMQQKILKIKRLTNVLECILIVALSSRGYLIHINVAKS